MSSYQQFDVRRHHDAVVALLRTLEGTKLPLKLRKGSARGPRITCTIHRVHKGDRIEIASAELAQQTAFADQATFFINVSDIHDVEVNFAVPERAVPTEDVPVAEEQEASTPGPRNGRAKADTKTS